MKSNLLIFFFCVQSLFSQSVLKGKVVSELGALDGVFVANLTTKASVSTNNGGFFTIEAKSGDHIAISSKRIEGIEIILNTNSFKNEMLTIRVKNKVNELEEIEVKNISTKSLGIVSKNVKEYTPAERKLRTAEKFKWFSPLLIPFGGMSVDGLLNKISGRTAMLEKELQLEKYETNLDKLSRLFPDASFFTDTLQIPLENRDGFLLFASENINVINALHTKNEMQIRFTLLELAVEFKSINGIK